MIACANLADDAGMDQTPEITVGAVSLSVAGDQLAITHTGKAGTMRITVPAAKLERWARAILREEAFSSPAPDTEQQAVAP